MRQNIDQLFEQARNESRAARTGITIQLLEELLRLGEGDEEFMGTEQYRLAHRNLGTLYHDHHQHWKVADHIRRAIELGTRQTSDLYRKLGRSLFIEGEDEGAVSALERALELDSTDEEAHFYLGWAYARLASYSDNRNEQIRCVRLALRERDLLGLTSPGNAKFLQNVIAASV